MNSLSLTACSFHLKKLNSKNLNGIYYLNKDITYNNEDDENKVTSVMEMFSSFANEYISAENDNEKQKTFSCKYLEHYHFSTDSYIFLPYIVKSGYYGSSGEIFDSETREHKYKMTPKDVVEKPFYVFIIIPKDNNKVKVNKGLLIFQNIGIFGVKTITSDKINVYFTKKYHISMKCATITPEIFVKKVIIKENIKKLIMIKNHKSSEDTDKYYNGYGTESRIIGNLHFDETAWGKIFSGITHVIKGKYNLFEFGNIAYDKLKIQVDIGGRSRTIDLNNIENLSVIEGIPDEIRTADGYADLEKLIAHTKNVTDEYMKEMVLEIK